jgi:hypothetical protein
MILASEGLLCIQFDKMLEKFFSGATTGGFSRMVPLHGERYLRKYYSNSGHG